MPIFRPASRKCVRPLCRCCISACEPMECSAFVPLLHSSLQAKAVVRPRIVIQIHIASGLEPQEPVTHLVDVYLLLATAKTRSAPQPAHPSIRGRPPGARVSLWDGIIQSKEHAKFWSHTTNKYHFTDQGNNLRGKDYNLTLHWHIMPKTGKMFADKIVMTGYSLSENYK
ncbi:uncharacterized protein LOC121974806 isoform X2 [Zingiber officinale]|uniref:uncharacterized protein LOC121974806 isoform X2 n=1 Tax=Zingiber officinale TaxID=94328 RepID=UPI001C4A7C2B|nr:uncharacterized protein LOC121974806 isoform X2 [Zingiber officinale]